MRGQIKTGRDVIGQAVRITVARGCASFEAWVDATPAAFRDRVAEAEEIVVSARWPSTAGAVMVSPVAFDPRDAGAADGGRRWGGGGE